MKNSTKGFVAGAAGVGLLLGASTFAIWTDSSTANGGKIASGNLNVEVTGSEWVDASAKSYTGGGAIDLETFQVVPGDTLVGTYDVDVNFEGDNMIARLSLKEHGLDGNLADEMAISYQLLHDGEKVGKGDSQGAEVVLATHDNGDVVNSEGSTNLQLVVEVDFGEDVKTLQDEEAVLANAELSFEQVRPGATPGNIASSDS